MMNYNELLRYNRNRRVCQIGFVTNDLEKTMRGWVEGMGVGPFKVLRKNDCVVNGEVVHDDDYARYIALATMGNVEIEVMCPIGSKSHLWGYMEEHGCGFHHFKEYFSIEEEEKAQREFAERGMPVVNSGRMAGDSAWFVDSEPLVDFKLECGNLAYLCDEDLERASVTWFYFPAK